MGTKTQIQLLLTNENARKKAESSNITSSGLKGEIERSFKDVIDENYVTLEHNFWVLDGQYKFMNYDDPLYGAELPKKIYNIQSTNISDWNGELPRNTNVTIDIGEEIKTDKITITYGTYYNYYNSAKQIDNTCNGSRARTFRIHLYDSNDQEIYNEVFDENQRYTENYSLVDLEQEYEFSKIKIDFLMTARKYRTLKVQSIYFGEIKKFEDEIISANLLQETSYLCNTVPIGTLEFEVYSANDEFNALNPDGIFEKLHTNTYVKLIEEKDGEIYNYGTYFLKSWETSNEKITKFNCEDAISLLDEYEGEYNSRYGWGVRDRAQTQLFERFQSIFAIPYLIADKFPVISFTYWSAFVDFLGMVWVLDNSSIREQLQKLCFGRPLYTIICSGQKIEIKQLSQSLEDEGDIFGIDDIIIDTDKINQIKAVKAITLNNHTLILEGSYVSGGIPEADCELLYEGTLDKGFYNFYFDDAYYIFQIEGFIYHWSDAPENMYSTSKHLYLEVENDQTNVKITGRKFEEQIIIQKKTNEIENIEETSSLVIENYNYMWSANSFLNVTDDLIDSLLEYYNGSRYQYVFSTRNLRNPESALGRYIKVESKYGKKIAGNIVKIETDLFNGLIYTITIDGVLEEE